MRVEILVNRDLSAQDGTVINAGTHITEGKIGVNYRFNPQSIALVTPAGSRRFAVHRPAREEIYGAWE
jgi:hypothetical protein